MIVAADTPHRTEAQRSAALAKANRIRSYRARLKLRLDNLGRRDAAHLAAAAVANPAAELETMRVADLLRALPRVGDVRVNACMRSIGIAPGKTLAGVSPRQRRELLNWLDEYLRGRR